MQLSDAPAKLVEAFAVNGSKNTIPVASQIPITPGAASYNDGFPPLTMTAPTSGGVPPSGLDFNGILNAATAVDVWMSCGAGFPWDAGFSATIGGYPKGSRVLAASGAGYWLSTVDNNVTNPDASGAGWALQGATATSSVYASANQTLSSGSYPTSVKVLFDTVEFDSGLWDAADKRFVAPYTGNYRVSGAITLGAAPGQTYGTQIARNGTILKMCCQFPQVSNGNITLPFDAVIFCAATNYLEVFMLLSEAAASAGVGGNGQIYVFAQCEYLGT